MNLVGKIFVVLIFVMSLVFASFVVVVYATHKNWRDVVEKEYRRGQPSLQQLLANADRDNKALREDYRKRKADFDLEKQSLEQANGKLESKLVELKGERDTLSKEKDSLERQLRESVAAVSTTQAEAGRLRAQVETLSADLVAAQRDRDAHFKEVIKVTDEVHQVANEVMRLKELNVKLSEQLRQAMETLRVWKIPLGGTKDTPPGVDGVVRVVSGDGHVQISLGADMGILKGHRLKVVRMGGGAGSNFVGEIEVIRTTPTESVCKVVNVNTPIQVGDRVFTRLD